MSLNTKLKNMSFKKKDKDKKIKINGQRKSKKEFFSKLSGGFMLPISVMSIAGLLLGIGSAITTNANSEAMQTFGNFIKSFGDPVFAAMPVLFGLAIVIAFTDEAGAAAFSLIIGLLVFSAIQSVFIDPVLSNGKIIGYKILFEQAGRDPVALNSLVGKVMGITSLNTSIFGGIIVGTVVASLYNRFYQIQLPAAVAFFGGKRFIPIVTMIAMAPLAFLFLLFWPWIGIGLYKFGSWLGSVPYGFESFIFGYIERALVPFGLHHVFYAPLWWTSAGGNATQAFTNWINNGNVLDPNIAAQFKNAIHNPNFQWTGDSFIWISANQLPFNTVGWTDAAGAHHSLKVFDFFSNQLHIKLGRFLDGKYPFMIFGLPAAAAAIMYAAPKENRKLALGTVFPAALTAFLTGVTEPIEFTFLFLAPALYWGFHSIMAAISFMLMNVLGVHIGMVFSGGMLDLIIYGILPFAKGTHFWWVFIVGPVYAVIYYFVFYYWIKIANLSTPGRGSNVKLFTKADYNKRKNNRKHGITVQSQDIVKAFGGWENIVSYSNCATRLRYDVKDPKKVNIKALEDAGAYGVMKVGVKHFQVILGPVASQVNTNIVSNKNAALV